MFYQHWVHCVENTVRSHLRSYCYEQRLKGIFIRSSQQFVTAPIAELVVNEVDGPDMVGSNAKAPLSCHTCIKTALPCNTYSPSFSTTHQIKPISNYPKELSKSLALCAENTFSDLNIIVLMPGTYNSAYYEH